MRRPKSSRSTRFCWAVSDCLILPSSDLYAPAEPPCPRPFFEDRSLRVGLEPVSIRREELASVGREDSPSASLSARSSTYQERGSFSSVINLILMQSTGLNLCHGQFARMLARPFGIVVGTRLSPAMRRDVRPDTDRLYYLLPCDSETSKSLQMFLHGTSRRKHSQIRLARPLSIVLTRKSTLQFG